jgi:signal transduction histidine kinase
VLVVLAYGAGAYLEIARAVWTIVVLDAAFVVLGLLLALLDDYDSLEYFPVPFWLAMAWVVGRLMRSWRLRAEELEGLTAELAAERDARAKAAVEAERMRIAHELHDVVAHNVSVMTIQATAASRILVSDPAGARDALASVERTGRETVDEMRILLGVLRDRGKDEPFAPQPGLAELDALAERVGSDGLPVEVVVEGRPRPLAAGLDLAAYRIVQEALTNVLKHAVGAHARVTVRYTDTALEREVVDDGAGNGTGGGTGNGLVGMQERVAMYGGQVEMGRRREGGWALRARLPVGST